MQLYGAETPTIHSGYGPKWVFLVHTPDEASMTKDITFKVQEADLHYEGMKSSELKWNKYVLIKCNHTKKDFFILREVQFI